VTAKDEIRKLGDDAGAEAEAGPDDDGPLPDHVTVTLQHLAHSKVLQVRLNPEEFDAVEGGGAWLAGLDDRPPAAAGTAAEAVSRTHCRADQCGAGVRARRQTAIVYRRSRGSAPRETTWAATSARRVLEV
jgi:hypothetical protein